MQWIKSCREESTRGEKKFEDVRTELDDAVNRRRGHALDAKGAASRGRTGGDDALLASGGEEKVSSR
jgi:hypothetical protein